jgi:hypothetical protein
MVFSLPLQLHLSGRKIEVGVTSKTAFGFGKRDVNIHLTFTQVGMVTVRV